MFRNKSLFSYKKKNKPTKEDVLEPNADDVAVKPVVEPKESTSLLDVTVIRPSQTNSNHKFITQTSTLNSSQVRDLITSMEMGAQDKNKLLHKIFRNKLIDPTTETSDNLDATTTSLSKVLDVKKRQVPPLANCFLTKKCTCTVSVHKTTSKPLNDVDHCIHSFEGGDQKTEHQVYTTAKSYRDVSKVFTCKNKLSDEKEEPCDCRNCALLGVITDTQKTPLFAGPIEASGFDERMRRRHSEHQICNLQYRRLAHRISELEERLSTQEDRSVAKDYFKRIITKLVSHITKITNTAVKPHKHEKKYDRCHHEDARYQVNPVLIVNNNDKLSEQNYNILGPKEIYESVTESEYTESERIWKWSGDILKPGIDLKNKITSLVEERLRARKTVGVLGEGSKEQTTSDKEIRIYVDVLSEHLYYQNQNYLNLSNGSDEGASESCYYKQDKEHLNRIRQSNIHVAYVNPKIHMWQEYSQNSIPTYYQRYRDEQMNQDLCKERFKVILDNTKSDGKKKLWNTIWNQAMTNCLKKNDRVAIQIPQNDSKGGIIEFYYTIAELEQLLI